MDLEGREYLKPTASANVQVSSFNNMGPLKLIFVNEYIVHHFYMNKTTCNQLCEKNGGTLGKFLSKENLWKFYVTIKASNDDMSPIQNLFQNQSFSNETDYRLAGLMQKYRVGTELSFDNYQFHVDVGTDLP